MYFLTAIDNVLRSNEFGDETFIIYLTKSHSFRKKAERHMTGSAGQKRVFKNIFFSYKIPIPPIDEQKKIGSIIARIDMQLNFNTNYLSDLQELKKGYMQDLLTGKVRVEVN